MTGAAMPRYLVTYDLHDHDREDALLKCIKRLGGANELTESTYIVTGSSASAVLTAIRDAAKDRITVYVLRLRTSNKHHAEFHGT